MTTSMISRGSPRVEARSNWTDRGGPVLVAIGGRDTARTLQAARAIAAHLQRDCDVISIPGPKGGIPSAVARVASERNAALLVMGTGRHQMADRLLGAETALHTVRQADCPVLVVANSLDAAPACVVVGVDFSPSSLNAAQLVLSLISASGTMHLVHAWAPKETKDDEACAANERHRRTIDARMRGLTESLVIPASVTVKYEVHEGPPTAWLIDVATTLRAEVIAVGRHGRAGVERLLMGSVTERLLREASCSLYVAQPRAIRRRMTDAPDLTAADQLRRESWAAALDAFTRRAAGRIVSLTVREPELGLVIENDADIFFGASYDEGSRRISIIIGEANGRREHLVRTVADANMVAVLHDSSGRETALFIEQARGHTVVSLHS